MDRKGHELLRLFCEDADREHPAPSDWGRFDNWVLHLHKTGQAVSAKRVGAMLEEQGLTATQARPFAEAYSHLRRMLNRVQLDRESGRP